MDQENLAALQDRLETLIRLQWSEVDSEVVVTTKLRNGKKVDVTVISSLFEGKDGLAREAFFWPVFETVPKSELIYMTYCLLLTPDEAATHFSGTREDTGKSYVDSWE